MAKFTPLLHIPKSGDPYYNTKGIGGYSPCIVGNIPKSASASNRTGYSGLNVYPNCVGHAVGRFNEIGGYGYCKYLANVNAAYMIEVAKRQGLEITQQPTLGGVMVWANGGAGHVALVEVLHKDASITTSESEWNGVVFKNYRRYNADGNWRKGCYWMGAKYQYLGCIKNPAVKDGEEEVTQEQFNEMMNVWLEQQKAKEANAYAEESLNWAVDNGIMGGDASGNLMPQSFLKRQDFVTMLKRFENKLDGKEE